MKDLEILDKAFEYIEENLSDEIKTQDVADACYCSKSVSLERMQNEAGKDDIVFRIGGDEFAMLTASENAEYAK